MTLTRLYFAVLAVHLFLSGMSASCLAEDKPVITRERRDAIVASRDRIASAIETYERTTSDTDIIDVLKPEYFQGSKSLSGRKIMIRSLKARCLYIAVGIQSLVDYIACEAYESEFKKELLHVLNGNFEEYAATVESVYSNFRKATANTFSNELSHDIQKLSSMVGVVSEEARKVGVIVENVKHSVVKTFPRFSDVNMWRNRCTVDEKLYESYLDKFMDGVLYGHEVPIVALLSSIVEYKSLLDIYLNYSVVSYYAPGVSLAPGVKWKTKSYSSAWRDSAKKKLQENVEVMRALLSMVNDSSLYPYFKDVVACATLVVHETPYGR